MHFSPLTEWNAYLGEVELGNSICKGCPDRFMIINIQLPPVINITPQPFWEASFNSLECSPSIDLITLIQNVHITYFQIIDPSHLIFLKIIMRFLILSILFMLLQGIEASLDDTCEILSIKVCSEKILAHQIPLSIKIISPSFETVR